MLDVESVDLNLDYENDRMTSEKKKQLEHVLCLERHTFDSYNISEEVLIRLESFMRKEISV